MVGDPLPESWRWSTLGDVADPNSRAIVSGPFGSNIGSRFFVEQGVPVIRGNNLTTDMIRFIDDGFVFLTEEKADELGNCDAVVDDIVFTAAGSLGQVGIIPKKAKYPRYIISNKQLRARLDKRRIDPLFAFYWFSSKEMVEYVQQRNTGSSVPLINLSVLRSLPVPLPPLSEQRAIVDILGTLDNKIELNRQMNETLAAIARAIFKSWFVDFDPVRGRAEGLDHGLPKHVADLFPNRFVDSELGEIPAGWRVVTLGDVADVNYGKNLPQTELLDRGIPVYGAAGTMGFYPEAMFEEPVLLITCRGSSSGNLHETWGPAFVTNNSMTIVPKEQWLSRHYLHGALKHADRQSVVSGSAQPQIILAHLNTLRLVFPEKDPAIFFSTLAESLWQKIASNKRENDTLSAIRDALLPNLISGEIRVKNAEYEAERSELEC